MAGTPLDSQLYRSLLGDAEVARLFADSAEVRAMLIVLGTLAEVQGAAGLIPAESAAAIKRASLEVEIDPGALAAETGRSAVPLPALVAAFRAAMQAPEHAAFVHWGATSQDIMDTGLVLRLRQVAALYEARLGAVTGALGRLAAAHADLPMAGRTYGQVAVPTSFGAVVAGWGWPLVRARRRLSAVRDDLLVVSLSGAAGTLSAMGPQGPEVRTGLARALGLGDPGGSWHAQRDRVADFAGWMAGLASSLGKMGEDLLRLTQSEVAEVTLPGSGSSSTMPQKTNPVAPSLLVAIARQAVALNAAMQGAQVHGLQRDGAAWITEWMSLPQLCILTGRALALAEELTAGIAPRPERMLANLDDGLGLIHAEALSFALAARMPRPEAQAEVKALCTEARASGTHLETLVAARHEGDWSPVFDPARQLGEAPAEARRFAETVNSD